MNSSKVNSVLLVLSIMLIIGGGIYLDSRNPKMAHVNTTVLYEEFDMKLELEKKLEKVQQERKRILDSLMVGVQQLSALAQKELGENQETINKFQFQKQNYLTKEQNFTEDNQALAQKYTRQIWKQLNQYVKDYGNEHSYAYIFGADGSGALMSGDKTLEITDEVKVYVNNRYKGVVAN